MTPTNCIKCGTELVVGTAIKPAIEYGARSIVPVAPLKAHEVQLIKVMKCPSCGHSEEIE